MKRLISVIIILTMALSLALGVIPASAENSGDSRAEVEAPIFDDKILDTPSAVYIPDWKALSESENMVSQLDGEENESAEELFYVDATNEALCVKANDGAELDGARFYFSNQLFKITATTYYEYVFNAKSESAGAVIARANRAAYALYCSLDNTESEGEYTVALRYGENFRLVNGTSEAKCKLILDGEFSSFKVIYNGYRVSVYALVDNGGEGEWSHLKGLDFTLPSSAFVCLGACVLDGGEITLKSAAINAYNKESAAILNGDTARAELISLIYSTEDIIFGNYTEQTASALLSALSDAITALSDDSADVTEQKNALEAAILGLIVDVPDLYELKKTYSLLKYSEEYRAQFNKIALAQCLLKIETVFNKDIILNSDVSELEAAIAEIPVVSLIYSAEDFAAMEAKGCYRLAADIALSESYPEFAGYFDGGNHTVTLNGASGVFESLNGAEVIDLTIASENNVQADTPCGALSAFATGKITVTGVTNLANLTSSKASAAGFIAECEGASVIFTNCINKGKIVGKSAAGFVATARDGSYSDLAFKYCAALGGIESSGSMGAFFACGNAGVIMYGCVVGGFEPLSVVASDSAEDCALGGVVGGAVALNVDACYFNIDLSVVKNTSDAPSALVVGSVSGGAVEIRNIYLAGELVSSNDNVYRITSCKNAVLESAMIFTALKKDVNGVVFENESALDKTPNTDTSVLDEKSLRSALAETSVFVVAATVGNSLDEKIKTTEQFIFAINSVKTCVEASLDAAKSEALAGVFDAIKDSANYTPDSYGLYFADIESLISAVNSAPDEAALLAIDLASALALAESKLVTPEAHLASELAKAKLAALTVLSAKRENAGNVFTAASYNEYLTAFDAIVAQINSAQSLEALAEVDVALLKVNAENKLVVATREAILDDEDSSDDVGNLIPDDDDGTPNDDYRPVTDSSSGCSSSLSLSFSALTLVSLLGTALVIKKKD